MAFILNDILYGLTLFADDKYAPILHKRHFAEWYSAEIRKDNKKVKEIRIECKQKENWIVFVPHKRSSPVQLVFNKQTLTSKQHMNNLGVAFDTKLNWQSQIENAIATWKKALHTIYL